MSAFVGLLLVFNIAVIMIANIGQIRKKFTLWSLRRRAIKARKEKLEQQFKKSMSHTSQVYKSVGW